jgi:RNA polymerase sigma factor (sigma-70 family)
MDVKGTEAEDTEVMRALADNKDSALNRLIEKYQQPLFSFLFRFLQNETDAADLAQECFVRMYQNRHRFDPKQRFTTWMFQIAANLAKDRVRWRSRHPEANTDTDENFVAETPSQAAAPDADLLQKEMGEAVREAIGKLPEDLRLPLIFSQYENRPHNEIAEIIGCTPKAVETRIYRAKQLLRKDLEGFFKNVSGIHD